MHISLVVIGHVDAGKLKSQRETWLEDVDEYGTPGMSRCNKGAERQ